MSENTFTLIDAFNQFWTACEDGDRRALSCAGLTYYYLCKVWNSTGRLISFRRQNTIICADLCLSKPTLDRHRNILKQSGLIDYFSKGKGDANICYKILERKNKNEVVKKQNNFTTSLTTLITTDDTYKQSKRKEKEFFIFINGEIKDLTYLLEIFINDSGLKEAFARHKLSGDQFSSALEKWMNQNQGMAYADIPAARKHFLFWLPFYQTKNNNYYGTKQFTSGRKPTSTDEKTDLGYAGGL